MHASDIPNCQCRYVCQKAFRSPEPHSLSRLRFRGLFLHSASEQPQERAALHLLTMADLAPQAFPLLRTQDPEMESRSSCTKVERSCTLAVNSGLNKREFPYLWRLDASEPDPKLYILQLCVSASSCFLFSPLLPLTSFWPFLSFALSLSPSLNTCASLLVWQLKTLLWWWHFSPSPSLFLAKRVKLKMVS